MWKLDRLKDLEKSSFFIIIILKAITAEASEMASPVWKPISVPQPWSEGTTSIRGRM